MSWCVYYSNGGYMGDVQDAPALDVQAIVIPDGDVKWAIVTQKDYYIWDNDTWMGVDIFGLWDYLSRPGWKKVLFGRTLPKKQWRELYQRVKADAVFGKKNGYLPQERKP